ncbi:DUF5665 domain-containing protein [Desulforamulus hydrothermalis]|uniref:Uncharacterized protein n=1 Tax=Desulforamulus hydrothermalis Lam5 = DSM 18033 TaxID=1121428 RepID=K8EEL2_9FIRM|nr:DUF5665 domain-containing protein [Desulforamulus hydrothermalis]CCO07216.1 conserved hypothetical protein [Desulforamulus hydrothermalis Lam5 = DSM 18033]SHG87728.1 hypothetical protein SAMN02745177_00657 [Desulforamulus hydrothermalis Lam5 = DSM 18033]
MEQLKHQLCALRERIDALARNMEKMKLAEYVALLEDTRRLLWVNFISGIARGLGIAVGFTILGAAVLYFLQKLLLLNLPLVSDFIAQIVQMVQIKMY